VVEPPAAVGKLFGPEDGDGIGEAFVGRGIDRTKVIQSPEDVIVPARGKSRPQKQRIDDPPGAMRSA